MELYRKEVTSGGRVKYVLHTEQRVEVDMTDQQVLTLASTIAVCCLIGLEQHLPAHKAMSRRIREVEKAISGLATLAGGKLDDKLVNVGTGAWGAAMKHVSECVH